MPWQVHKHRSDATAYFWCAMHDIADKWKILYRRSIVHWWTIFRRIAILHSLVLLPFFPRQSHETFLRSLQRVWGLEMENSSMRKCQNWITFSLKKSFLLFVSWNVAVLSAHFSFHWIWWILHIKKRVRKFPNDVIFVINFSRHNIHEIFYLSMFFDRKSIHEWK